MFFQHFVMTKFLQFFSAHRILLENSFLSFSYLKFVFNENCRCHPIIFLVQNLRSKCFFLLVTSAVTLLSKVMRAYSVFIVNRVIKMSFLVTVSQVQECLLFLSNRLETREIFENFFQFVVHVGSKK